MLPKEDGDYLEKGAGWAFMQITNPASVIALAYALHAVIG